MTDEERQKLCDDLWLIAGHERPVSHAICAEAADEIERLAKELAHATRLLEIGRRRSLKKSGDLEIRQSE